MWAYFCGAVATFVARGIRDGAGCANVDWRDAVGVAVHDALGVLHACGGFDGAVAVDRRAGLWLRGAYGYVLGAARGGPALAAMGFDRRVHRAGASGHVDRCVGACRRLVRLACKFSDAALERAAFHLGDTEVCPVLLR